MSPLVNFDREDAARDWSDTIAERLSEKPVSQHEYDDWLWIECSKDEELRAAYKLPAFKQGYMFMFSRHQVEQIQQLLTELADSKHQPAASTRKVWRKVRPTVQIEGMIDDGYELVDEPVESLPGNASKN